MIGQLNKKQLEILRLMVWERLIRNTAYRTDYFELLNHQIKLNIDFDSYMEKYNAFVEKWNLPTPLHPDWSWEEIAEYKDSWKWFMGHSLELMDYPTISKTFLKKVAKHLSTKFPALKEMINTLPKKMANRRFSSKWEIAYRVYDLCETEGKTEEEATIIIKAETKGKVDLTDDAIHKAKKRVYELIFNEPFTSKRERRKKQFGGLPPCANCTGRECEKTKEICEEMDCWFLNTLTRPDEETPARYDRLSKHGNNKYDEIRAQREMAAYLAYPTCVFENPETGDSFAYHSPEAVKVFFHVPQLRLNSVSISKRVGFFNDP